MKYLGEGFSFIGFGIMCLCIRHGCSQCDRTKAELRMHEKWQQDWEQSWDKFKAEKEAK